MSKQYPKTLDLISKRVLTCVPELDLQPQSSSPTNTACCYTNHPTVFGNSPISDSNPSIQHSHPPPAPENLSHYPATLALSPIPDLQHPVARLDCKF